MSCTSQLQQWNKPALKPNSPTIRDACFTVHKDDKAHTAAVVCKPTITYYDPHRPGDRVVNEACFDKGFRECSLCSYQPESSVSYNSHWDAKSMRYI